MREAMRRAGGSTADRFEERRGLGGAIVAVLIRHPLDSAAAVLAGALALGIIVNALALQAGVHHHIVRRPAPAVPAARVANPVPMPAAAPAVAPLPPRTTATTAPPAAVAAAPTESLITAIQTELKRRGVYRDKIDGTLGPKTEAAILSFQVAAGLPPTAQPSETLLSRLRGR